MDNEAALKWSVGIIAGAAVGASAWMLLRHDHKKDLADKIEIITDHARDTTSNWVHTLRERAVPLIASVGNLLETNAEVVSAVAHISADKVRKTGKDIREAAPHIDRTLESLASF